MLKAAPVPFLLAALLFLAVAVPQSAHAISQYTNITEVDYVANNPLPHRRQAPWTVFHPNPIHGFASSQGVSALAGDGSGLAVHAQADLVPGATQTRSTAIAAIEFEIVDPSTATAAPVDVSFLGKYLVGLYGEVKAWMWRGIADHRGSAGNPVELLFFAGPSTNPDVGIWSVERTLMTRQIYTLELVAVASAYDGFNLSSNAFIDPVISFDGGPGVEMEIQFSPSSTLANPEFVDVPEPRLPVLAAGAVLAWLGVHRGGRRRGRATR